MKNLSKNKKINNSLSKFLPGSLHYNFNFNWDIPTPHFRDGSGHALLDFDNKKYLDFFSKFGANILGHKNITYTNILSRYISENLTSVNHFGTLEIKAIKKVLKSIGLKNRKLKVRFCLSGTESVLNSIRLARAYTNKNKVIRFFGHYHGWSDDLLGGDSNVSSDYIPFEAQGDPRGTSGRGSNAFNNSVLVKWNDIGVLKEVLSLHSDIACVIMEPISINGGGVRADLEYFKELKNLSIKYGFLIIYDEVITGFRLNYGSCYKETGIIPDIWVFGKALAGGAFPVSCFVADSEIMEKYTNKKTTHGGTFNGYPLGLVAVDATLSILSKTNIYKKTVFFAEKIRELINQKAKIFNLEINVQGPAMAMVIHASGDIVNNTYDWTGEMKNKENIIRDVFMKHGVILAPPCRIYPNVMIDQTVVNYLDSKIDDTMIELKNLLT